MSSENKINLTHSQEIINNDETDITEEVLNSSTEEALESSLTYDKDEDSELEFYIPTAIPHWLTLMMEEEIEQMEEDIEELYRDWETDRKSTRLNSSHSAKSRMPSSA